MKINFSSLKVYVNTEIQKLHNVFSPILHSHGNITSNGMIGDSNNNANKNVVTDENGQITIEEKTEGLDSFNYGYIDENLQCHLIKVEEINILSADSQLLPSEDFNLSGEIITDDETNNPIAVKIYLNNDYLETVYTYGYDKSFDFSIEDSELVSGENTIKMQCGNVVLEHTCLLSQDVLTLTSDKDILSAADNDVATLTAKVYGADISGKSVVFKNGSTVLDTVTTDSNGEAQYEYTSQGAGDITITAECMSLQETYEVEDCVDVITADTDQTSKFGSSISLRNSGTSNISYDSTNKYYNVNITKVNSESFVPINSATGLDYVVIEFDGYLPITNSFLGLCFYKENSNWGRLGTKWDTTDSKFEYGGNTNGSYAESNISGYTPPTTTWLHHKFIIINDIVHRQVYNGETLIYEDARTYDGFFTSTTKFGFTALWSTHWKGYYKNITIKPIPKVDKPEEPETDELEGA